MPRDDRQGPLEIALAGDLTADQGPLLDKFLEVEPGEECLVYFDSLGGSPYCAIALVSLIRMRDMKVTGIVAGECSSAALWPFAACRRRIVTPYSTLLFHPMKWQSEENVPLTEAAEWARHFAQLESDMDRLLAELFGVPLDMIRPWLTPGRYVSGRELADAGLAELVGLEALPFLKAEGGRQKAEKKGRRTKDKRASGERTASRRGLPRVLEPRAKIDGG